MIRILLRLIALHSIVTCVFLVYRLHRPDVLPVHGELNDWQVALKLKSGRFVTDDSLALLTLVTSIPSNSTRDQEWERTFKNWALLGKGIQPVLYVQNDTSLWNNLPKRWHVHSVPTSVDGLPVLRTMILDAQDRYKSIYYGYANADILFDYSLRSVLICLHNYSDFLDGKLLLVGRRNNANLTTLDEETLAQLHNPDVVNNVTKSSPVFTHRAQDYFISFKNGFPWTQIPDFVIGRVAYDNWLVIKAKEWGYNLVDGSDSLHALHQTDALGDYAGFKDVANKYINRDLVKVGRKTFRYKTGSTYCAKLIVEIDVKGELFLKHRRIYEFCNRLSEEDKNNATEDTPTTSKPLLDMNLKNDESNSIVGVQVDGKKFRRE